MALSLNSIQILCFLVTLCWLCRSEAIPLEISDLDGSPSELDAEMQAVEEAMAAFLANNGTETEASTEQEPVKPKRTIGNHVAYGYMNVNSLANDVASQHRYPSTQGSVGLPTYQATPVRYYYTKNMDPVSYATNSAPVATTTTPPGTTTAPSLIGSYFATAPQSVSTPLLPTALPVIVVKVNEQGQVLGMHQAAMALNVQQMVMNYLQTIFSSSPTLLQPANVQSSESISKKFPSVQTPPPQQHQQQQQQTIYYGQYKTIRKPIDSQQTFNSSPEYSFKYPKE